MGAGPLGIWLVSQSYLPFHGGITEHVWHLGHELTRRGHRVTIVTGRAARNGHSEVDRDPPGVAVARAGATVRVPSNGAHACVTVGWNWGARLRGLQESPPAIIHLHSPLEPFLPLWILRNARGAKIGTFHAGGRRDHWGYRGFSPWLRRLASRLDARIGVSREAVRFAARHFPGEYEVIPNGVDLARFSPPASGATAGRLPRTISPARDEARLLCVGRLDPRKGLTTLIEAAARLRARGRRLRLVIVGDGPLRGTLQRRAARRRVAAEFVGAVGRSQLPHHYHEADLFVAPASDGESFGVSLLEALAAGTPIIAACIPGYCETLRDCGAARYFTPRDPEDLARAIGELLDSPHQRRDMRSAGLRFVQRYAWPDVAARVEEAYFAALARGRGGS